MRYERHGYIQEGLNRIGKRERVIEIAKSSKIALGRFKHPCRNQFWHCLLLLLLLQRDWLLLLLLKLLKHQRLLLEHLLLLRLKHSNTLLGRQEWMCRRRCSGWAQCCIGRATAGRKVIFHWEHGLLLLLLRDAVHCKQVQSRKLIIPDRLFLLNGPTS